MFSKILVFGLAALTIDLKCSGSEIKALPSIYVPYIIKTKLMKLF
jgi:hypothetical protein